MAYLPLLEQKINALEQAAPLQGWELPEEFATLCRLMEARMNRHGRREYVQVLRLLETFDLADLQVAVKQALHMGAIGFVPLSKTGAEILFELISQRYERGSILITSNLPLDEWAETFGADRLTGALLDRLTHHVSILEMNGESYRLAQSRARKAS